jgi:hypothetical protein
VQDEGACEHQHYRLKIQKTTNLVWSHIPCSLRTAPWASFLYHPRGGNYRGLSWPRGETDPQG